MLTRALLATILLAFPLAAQAAPKHAGHHPARVTTATYRVPPVHGPARELRASHGHHTRYAAGRHALTRGS